jgi:dipeptidyl-peptidase-4
MDLWEFNLADQEMRLLVDSTALISGEEDLSEEELARRERLRIVGQRGIVSYKFSPDGKRLLFPLSGDLYLYDLESRETQRLTETDAGETDPKFSSTGSYVSFIRDQNLFVIDLDSFEEKQLTQDGGGLIRNGMAEFIAQEEMDRYTGYWWAPDDLAIAFTRVDESPVQVADRFEIYAENFEVYQQRYPATGTPNALITLGVIAPDGSDLRWMDTGEETDIYLPRVDWFPDSEFLAVQRQSRDQKTLELLKIDAADQPAQRARVSRLPAAVHLEIRAQWICTPLPVRQRRRTGPPADRRRLGSCRRCTRPFGRIARRRNQRSSIHHRDTGQPDGAQHL